MESFEFNGIKTNMHGMENHSVVFPYPLVMLMRRNRLCFVLVTIKSNFGDVCHDVT